MTSNALYRKKYGAWAGFPQGHAPKLEQCCEEVRDNGRWPSFHQCNRKRGFGPDQAYCKQHDPAAKASRDKVNSEKKIERMNIRRYEWSGRTFFDVLKKIADGHNDARGLAADAIAEFKKGEYK